MFKSIGITAFEQICELCGISVLGHFVLGQEPVVFIVDDLDIVLGVDFVSKFFEI